MRPILLVIGLVMLSACPCFGQGSVVFANNAATRVDLYTADGQLVRVPVGSQFTAELMYAPDGTTFETFDLIAVRVGATATFGPVAGLFNGGGRTVDALRPAGGFGIFQVRVWETAYGASYQEAVGRTCFVGTSGLLRVDTGDPTTTPPGPAASLVGYGLTSFAVNGGICPEPGAWALGALAAAMVWLFRKKKQG